MPTSASSKKRSENPDGQARRFRRSASGSGIPRRLHRLRRLARGEHGHSGRRRAGSDQGHCLSRGRECRRASGNRRESHSRRRRRYGHRCRTGQPKTRRRGRAGLSPHARRDAGQRRGSRRGDRRGREDGIPHCAAGHRPGRDDLHPHGAWGCRCEWQAATRTCGRQRVQYRREYRDHGHRPGSRSSGAGGGSRKTASSAPIPAVWPPR